MLIADADAVRVRVRVRVTSYELPIEGEARLLDRHHRIAEGIFGIYSNMRGKVRWLCKLGLGLCFVLL